MIKIKQSNSIKTIVDEAFEHRDQLSPSNAPSEVKQAILEAIHQLNTGKRRIAEKIQGNWQINQWLKKAVLLYFRIADNQTINHGYTQYFDKIPAKYQNYTTENFQNDGTRVVPTAIVRTGAFIGKNTILMPCFINIGAYVGSGTMVDTWSTIGSCAQIGNNVHISGGAGIGGVLEPLQANPTVIEDNCFIGARSEIVEGVIVEEGSVISMGVYIGQSTRIYNRLTDEVSYGRIPAGSVVVPGTLPSSDGKCQLSCAIIVKQVDEKTRQKTSINELLRSVE